MKRLRSLLTPAFLLGLCVLAYALWAWRMGWYWDDFPIGWIARTYGGEGLARYFSTNRPIWGLLYRITTPLLGTHVVAWQTFAIFWRWVSGLALWWLLRLVWPRHREFALWTAALVLVYPGFSQQFIALVYSHFFIVLSAFFASLALTVDALRHPGRFWLSSGLAWALGLMNLLCMEYWFFLELVRPLLIWVVLGDGGRLPFGPFSSRLRQAFFAWLPGMVNFVGVSFWRMFFFHSAVYNTVLLDWLQADLAGALAHLAGRMVYDAWFTTVAVWQNAFHIPTHEELTPNLMRIFWGVVAAGAVGVLGFAWLTRREGVDEEPRSWFPQPLLIGLFCLLVGGVPAWMADLPLRLTFHFDRLNLSFMLGAALVTLGLLYLPPLPRWVRVIILAVPLGFCVGYQYQQAIVYIRDWNVMQRMFWQMSWRMPGLKPGAVLLSNELPVRHYSDNSLTAALNWVYAPDNRTRQMSYVLYYPSVRLGINLPALEKDLPLDLDYLAATYRGNTSLAVAFYYNPPACLRVIDPFVEEGNYTLPKYLRKALPLASTAAILPEGEPYLLADLFGTQSTQNWCYYFEKADLARQLGDWTQVVELGEAGFALGDYPNDPLERFPFIEAYAHTGDWERALEQTRLAAGIAPVYEVLTCRLWERIAVEAPVSPERDAAVQSVKQALRCDEPRQEPVQESTEEETP